MKPIFSFFCIAFLILLVCDVSYGRTKDLEEYWKKSMEGQKMPEVIKDLVAQNLPSVSSDVMDEEDGFVREFDIKPNVILYHSNHLIMSKEKMMKKNKKTEDRNLIFKIKPEEEEEIKKGG